jgi:uncharacterized membrane protein
VEKNFCDYGVQGSSSIEILEIKDEKLGNSKEWEWKPLDEISLRIRVKNNLDTKEKVTVAISLYSEKTGFIELDGKNDELEETIRISDGDREYFYFNFKLPVEDLEEGKYTLFVKAFVDGEEDEYCYSSVQTNIDVEFEEDLVIDELPTLIESSCGQSQDLSFRIYNLNAGDEEEFRIRLYNKELGINLYSQRYELDEGESKKIVLSINVPKDVTEKTYKLDVIIEYDYRESSDTFREVLEGDYISLKVEGSCSTMPTAVVSAKLDSEARAGKELIVKATIVNTGSETKTFTISASSYADWASSAILDRTSVTLNAGASQEVTITLNVLKDASGENGFDIEVLEGTRYLSQPVAVTIAKASSFPSLTGLVSGLDDNAYLYGIGALNLLLVVAIIFVAVRVVRKRKEE